MSQQVLHAQSLDYRLTSKSHTPTKYKQSKSNFVEVPEKAVFLTGLKELGGDAYDTYRSQLYQDLQKYSVSGTQNSKIYIRKFDFPKHRNCAYLHLKTKSMADSLKAQKTLKLAGTEIKVYEYTPNTSHIEETLSCAASIGSEKQLLNINDGYDSGVNTNAHATRAGSPYHVSEDAKRISYECPNPPTVTTQQSVIGTNVGPDVTMTSDLINYKLKNEVVIPLIMLPEAFTTFYPEKAAQVLETAADGIMNQRYTAQQFNQSFSQQFCEMLEGIYHANFTPKVSTPQIAFMGF